MLKLFCFFVDKKCQHSSNSLLVSYKYYYHIYCLIFVWQVQKVKSYRVVYCEKLFKCWNLSSFLLLFIGFIHFHQEVKSFRLKFMKAHSLHLTFRTNPNLWQFDCLIVSKTTLKVIQIVHHWHHILWPISFGSVTFPMNHNVCRSVCPKKNCLNFSGL